ncbi:TonB-dependent receptor [Spongiibacter sp. KMU-158]|uniref:TonB-dependent receptor n=1 Tax=Spongiibacter pelagi TaxID=2760804 RepID=A0A927BZ08_9GAMM|nr:TonB-dependent receptor [Spongiibacter pelagi]MBD2858194.1 TonB-dependent receptor [Spongiibacter pelagi]
MIISKKTPLAIAIAVAGVVTSGHTLAQDAKPVLEEVLVTAQKREQNLQETPISISAFDAQALKDQGIADIEDVSNYVPNVQIAESPGGSTGATIGIRGSVTVNPAITWEPTVGIYMDGVFIAKNVGGIFDVAELERIEILRGPQGTLYGKNTVGGAVNLVTRKPGDEFAGTVKIGGGNFGYTEGFVSIDSGVLAEQLRVNVAVSKKDRDGFYNNTSVDPQAADKFKELDSTAARLAAAYQLSEALEIYYTYDWANKDNTPSFPQYEPAGSKTERRKNGAVNGVKYDKSENNGHALHISYDMGDMMLKSITALREMSFDDSNDYDGSDFTGFHAERHVEHEQLSQEFQLVGSIGSVDIVGGLFYFNEKADIDNPYFAYGPANPPTAPTATNNRINNFYGSESTSIAIFGQADWHITEQLTLSAGLRWTEEEKDQYIEHVLAYSDDALTGINLASDVTLLPYTTSNETWSNTTPSLIISYQLQEDVSVYAKAAQGWKSGGFNGEADTAAIAQTPYDEETVTSYELGMKARSFNQRLQSNIALFQNDIEDLQLSEFVGASGYSQIQNAGQATIQGLEIEILAALAEGLNLNVNYGYLDAEYDEFISYGMDIKDSAKFPYTPEQKASVGLEYVRNLSAGEFSARVDWSYTDDFDVYHDKDAAALTTVEAFEVVNARISLSEIALGKGNTRLEMALWGKNLTDEEYRLNGIPFTQAGYAVNYYGDPRTYGVEASLSF